MALITVAEVKAIGRIDYDTHDALLGLLIEEVEDFAGEICGIKLSSAEHTERLDGGNRSLWVNFRPITAVTRVVDKYLDDSIVPSADYFTKENRIVAEENTFFDAGADRFEVTYTAGYTTSTAPVGLKVALRALVLYAYDASAHAKGETKTIQNIAEESGSMDVLMAYALRRPIE